MKLYPYTFHQHYAGKASQNRYSLENTIKPVRCVVQVTWSVEG